jgi:hypothetical protein
VLSIGTLGLYGYGLGVNISELVSLGDAYDSATSIVTEDWWFWLMICLNILNIMVTVSKIILIFVEVNIEDSDEFNIFHMSEKVGQMNLDLELWPDVAKILVMLVNFGFIASL